MRERERLTRLFCEEEESVCNSSHSEEENMDFERKTSDVGRKGIPGTTITFPGMVKPGKSETLIQMGLELQPNSNSLESKDLRKTHKDPVGTVLHIQEANMDDTTQTKTHTECAAAGYMTTENRAKSERFQETLAFIPDVEDRVTFL
ncbi:hypothetical protein TNCV_1519001 [Trichonephila clavipes]|nr:hypothetical protein TNCV_1519001 [Trichonephila clavipes]